MPDATPLGAAARRRLADGPATSDLSVDELCLLETLGLRPLGLVMGSSVYHVGWQRAKIMENMELTVLSQAMHSARELAVQRLEAEAQALAADGVVGVRLVMQQPPWGAGLVEFLAVGTAVGPIAARTGPAPSPPFASNLNGQDFWKLRRYGYRPVGLAFGCCVYHVAHLGLGRWLQQVGRNAEMEAFTQATYDARESAMERMGAEARAQGADVVVAVALHEGTWGWDANVVEFAALGTAAVREDPRPELPVPQLVLGLQPGGDALAGLGGTGATRPPDGGTRPGAPRQA